MTNNDQIPTPKQLDYIRDLSRARGVNFSKPRTRTAASQQIEALKAIPAGRTEREIERDLGERIRPAGAIAAVREHEITGYGASCTWT